MSPVSSGSTRSAGAPTAANTRPGTWIASGSVAAITSANSASSHIPAVIIAVHSPIAVPGHRVGSHTLPAQRGAQQPAHRDQRGTVPAQGVRGQVGHRQPELGGHVVDLRANSASSPGKTKASWPPRAAAGGG